MKIDLPFISFIVCFGTGDYVLRSTEIEIPEIDSQEYSGGQMLIDHVHYYGDGSHWYVPRLNEINIRKPWARLLPTFEGDQSGSTDHDAQRAFLMRKLSEHIFGARMVDFDAVTTSEGYSPQRVSGIMIGRGPFHSALGRGGRKPSLDLTEDTAAKIRKYALRNMRLVDGSIIVRGHDPVIGVGIDNYLGNHAVLTVEDGVLWGTQSRSHFNFSAVELEPAREFKEAIHECAYESRRVWRGLNESMEQIHEKVSKILDLDLTEDPFERTLSATVPVCDFGKDWLAIPEETKLLAAKIVASLSTQPEERDGTFYEGLASYLENLPPATPLTETIIHWALERWDQRPVSLSPHAARPKIG
jgi:hypothetical protein